MALVHNKKIEKTKEIKKGLMREWIEILWWCYKDKSSKWTSYSSLWPYRKSMSWEALFMWYNRCLKWIVCDAAAIISLTHAYLILKMLPMWKMTFITTHTMRGGETTLTSVGEVKRKIIKYGRVVKQIIVVQYLAIAKDITMIGHTIQHLKISKPPLLLHPHPHLWNLLFSNICKGMMPFDKANPPLSRFWN